MMFQQQMISIAILACTTTSLLAQATSENSSKLKQALRKFPAADADGDGVLTYREAADYRNRILKRRPDGNVKQNSSVPPPTHIDIEYGPHDRNVLDLWIATSDEPTPLLVLIHGGGFQGGDKSSFRRNALVGACLNEGVSVASINYRLTDGGKHPYPIPMHDGARAIQFLRHHADRYNLDKASVAASGGSAGGMMSLWLGFHDDLADPDNEDPVLRESTRLVACAPNSGQSSVHLPTLLEWFGVESLIEHGGGRPLFGIGRDEPLANNEQVSRLSFDASPITHLTKDDPPVFFTAGAFKPISKNMSPNAWVHHPLMGIKLKEAMDKIGLESHVSYSGGPPVDTYRSTQQFLLAKLKPTK